MGVKALFLTFGLHSQFVFETVSDSPGRPPAGYAAKASIELESFCLHLLNAGIIGVYHHAHLNRQCFLLNPFIILGTDLEVLS